MSAHEKAMRQAMLAAYAKGCDAGAANVAEAVVSTYLAALKGDGYRMMPIKPSITVRRPLPPSPHDKEGEQ